ncbi:cadherin repeat domain-containing protein, partial [Pseudomonadales bacterium]|nr:cadherin repeat domain-containing protein [Pseudomonadales bacterium]
MAFLCLTLLTPKIFAANNGDILTNLVVLTYTGNGTGVSSTVDVVFVDPSLPTAIGPTALALNCEIEPDCNSLIVENAVGQILGSLSATDADQATGHVFTVLDDDRFEVVAGKLKLKATLSVDFEVAPTIALTVRVVDAAGNIFDQVLVLNIRDVNESPLNIVVDNRYVPPGSPGLAIGNISVEDPDLGEQHSYQILDDARFLIVD